MRHLTTRVSIVSLCLLSVTALHAQQSPSTSSVTAVPRVVRVAGSFHPANGLAAAPVEIVTLSIYAEETGGAPLWRETQNVTVDAEGRYTLLLGSTQAEGLPLDLFTSGEPRWLGMHVERPGEAEQPRVLLASVPYALRASDAATLGGRPPSAYVLAEPGAGEGAPGDARSEPTKSEPVTPAATFGNPNFIGKFITTSDISNSAIFEANGQVGVNTSTPLDAMHVRFTDGSGSFTGYAVQNMGGGANSYSGMLFYDQNNLLGQFQGFNNTTHEYRINNIAPNGSINFMIAAASRFFVANNGNIGIGTALPSQKLDVVGDINLTGTLRHNGLIFARVENSYTGFGTGTPIGTVAADNTVVGTQAGQSLTTGTGNTAVGSSSLKSNGTGVSNTTLGFQAMANATSPTGNVAIGALAGRARLGGSSANIYIGNGVADTAISESNTIRIGDTGGLTRTFIGGIRGVSTGVGDAVNIVIDSAGQLGTINSSRRYKEDIRDMGDASSLLMKLRPVTYRYKDAYADGSKPIDYGLIAEEVEEVYPDLVAHLADGEVETVQYHKINAMLLNEVQKQHRELQNQNRAMQQLLAEMEALKARLAALER